MQNLSLAFNLFEERLEIPQLLDSSDVSNGLVDERSVMTYLSMINRAFENKGKISVSSVSDALVSPRAALGSKVIRYDIHNSFSNQKLSVPIRTFQFLLQPLLLVLLILHKIQKRF